MKIIYKYNISKKYKHHIFFIRDVILNKLFVIIELGKPNMKIKYLLFSLSFILLNTNFSFSANKWDSNSIRGKEISIWSNLSKNDDAKYIVKGTSLIGGKVITRADKVTNPTITFYPAKGKNTGVTVVVFPGGGYKILALDLEGTEICDWLTAKGINCTLLKYRVPFSGPYWDEKLKRHIEPKVPMALQDAQRTMGLLRLHAKELNINLSLRKKLRDSI